MSNELLETETPETVAPEAPAPVVLRYCLSGSGKTVTGKKSYFAPGGDAVLKSKLIAEALTGEVDHSIPDQGREYALAKWPEFVGALADGTHEQLRRNQRKITLAQEKEAARIAKAQEKAARAAKAKAEASDALTELDASLEGEEDGLLVPFA